MTGCELCGRSVETTTHHLTPKDRKNSATTELCEPCHRQVHATFTHHELKHEYNSIEALRASDELSKFVQWIQGTTKTSVSVNPNDRVKRWRR